MGPDLDFSNTEEIMEILIIRNLIVLLGFKVFFGLFIFNFS